MILSFDSYSFCANKKVSTFLTISEMSNGLTYNLDKL